jgi:hypothetical protein
MHIPMADPQRVVHCPKQVAHVVPHPLTLISIAA